MKLLGIFSKELIEINLIELAFLVFVPFWKNIYGFRLSFFSSLWT